MATYSIEVESNAVALTTGRLGTACATYHGHDYRVVLALPQGRRYSGCTRDGYPCGIEVLPRAVVNFALAHYDMLCKAWINAPREMAD